jgi:hypothetical protein
VAFHLSLARVGDGANDLIAASGCAFEITDDASPIARRAASR